MSNPYLLLWFEAPLQAWGFDSKFGRRETLAFPTKSGVLGLLCCALGYSGEQREFLAAFAELDMQVVAYPRESKQKMTQSTILRDFHMVGSGYDESDPWQKMLIPKTKEGKPAVGGGAKLTYRYYLQDMAFAVALEVPHQQIELLVEAMKSPVWDLYLGRKCCVPTEFIYQGVFESSQQVFTHAEQFNLNRKKNRYAKFKVIQGNQPDLGEVLALNDVPLNFGESKHYRDRFITIIDL
ncbi:CRISPR-associated protein Cas5 [Chelonobacter oris]|uniref:CRISPR-associated protein Cas5 n=1 Tax=Chelonobacter oris TaxID=505317 RepID=A0A0A3AL63_9PAST|nr:type I-E CRISPR-associated protein Cas5/CasD [Chelonobacter oris]KGQ70071.1 CRISPR-associated protein Cas5 [Chelonobacter oris]